MPASVRRRARCDTWKRKRPTTSPEARMPSPSTRHSSDSVARMLATISSGGFAPVTLGYVVTVERVYTKPRNPKEDLGLHLPTTCGEHLQDVPRCASIVVFGEDCTCSLVWVRTTLCRFQWQIRSVLPSRPEPIQRNQLLRCVHELPQVAESSSSTRSLRAFSHPVQHAEQKKKNAACARAEHG